MSRTPPLPSAIALLIACTPPGAGSESTGSLESTTEDSDGSPGDVNDDTPPAADGLPCEIDELLASHCHSCHGSPPIAPMTLLGRGDLLAPAPTQPELSTGELAIMRMRDTQTPMPPAPASVPEGAIAAFERWVGDGMPPGDCDRAPGGGTTSDPAASECTSGMFWDRKDHGDPLMHPGRACIDCHATEKLDHPGDEGIPDLRVGGTVYPTLHEPHDCIADQVSGVVIRVRSTEGESEVELVPNASGNFLLHAIDAEGLTPPFEIEIRRGDARRRMPIPAPHGDCNACHTQHGDNGAPGRIVAP